MVAMMKDIGDQCEVRKTVIVDILDIGNDSNVDNEIDADYGCDNGIDDNTVKGDEGGMRSSLIQRIK